MDPEAMKQLRETRETLLETLRDHPEDLLAQVLAELIAEIDPDRDARLLAQRDRFRRTRPQDWQARAQQRGAHRLLFHIAHGWAEAGIGRAVVPVLERFATEISEARPAGVPRGHIDRSMIPEALLEDPRVRVAFHPSGHLSEVKVRIDELHEGSLSLSELPGRGSFHLVEKRGGYGTAITERYAGGRVHSTFNSPWHDGEESSYAAPWTKWVLGSLDDIARIAGRG